jgi:hypothetical protein
MPALWAASRPRRPVGSTDPRHSQRVPVWAAVGYRRGCLVDTRWRARGQHWRSSNVNALTIGAHEPLSTLRRRSRMEASGPRRYVTAHGRPTGGSGGPRCGTGCGERRCARGRPRGGCGVPPPPAESYSGQAHSRLGRPCRTSVRTLRGRRSRRRTRPDHAVPDPCASRRSGRPEAPLPERTAWWSTCRGADSNTRRIAATRRPTDRLLALMVEPRRLGQPHLTKWVRATTQHAGAPSRRNRPMPRAHRRGVWILLLRGSGGCGGGRPRVS